MIDYNFAVFILTHGRPNNVITYETLKKCGYTGEIYIIIDNEDKTAEKYYEKFGKKVIMFDKKQVAQKIDEADNFNDRRAIIYARNACFDIAEKLGIEYFIQLDDDYTNLSYMYDEEKNFKQKNIRNIDGVFNAFLKYFESINAESIAFLQRGDLIGGEDNNYLKNNNYPFIKRKAMNSFICSTKRRFYFNGRINEDVNTYTQQGSTGKIFMSIPKITLNQKQTQSNKGGMTDIYLDNGTYIKSFYTIIFMPSSVKISLMGTTHKRLHHSVCWVNTVPQILEEKYKK